MAANTIFATKTILASLLAIGIGSHYTPKDAFDGLRHRFTEAPAPLQGALLFLVAVVLHEAASAAAVPFVYFQF